MRFPWSNIKSDAVALVGLQVEEERQKEVSQMRASLEQMRAANQERRLKQQTAEARLLTLKVILLDLGWHLFTCPDSKHANFTFC